MNTNKILFLDHVAGIAGDMFAASFINAGLVDPQELKSIPDQLGLKGVEIFITPVIKATMQATHLEVKCEQNVESIFDHHLLHHHHQPWHTHPHVSAHVHYIDLRNWLEKSKLEPQTKTFALKVFDLLAQAEATAHGISVDHVSFHEVGAVDSIVDVAMAGHCITKVGACRVYSNFIKLGRGVVKMEHGVHPVPPPASAHLSVGMSCAEIPTAILRKDIELSTPTGLSILKALSPTFIDAWPAGQVCAVGMGAGTMDLGQYPNVFRIALFEENVSVTLPYDSDVVIEVSCNIDDETSEKTAWVLEKLLSQGALDVWLTPIVGKKNRAAVSLSFLSSHENWQKLCDFLLQNSSTYGIRYRKLDRLKLVQKIEKRSTPQGEIRFKQGFTTTGKLLKEKPEFEDLKKIWEENGKIL